MVIDRLVRPDRPARNPARHRVSVSPSRMGAPVRDEDGHVVIIPYVRRLRGVAHRA
jgi:hypothetical protein